MALSMDLDSPSHIYTPGEVLALLTPMQELAPGLYLLQSIADGWATLSGLIDDEEAERLLLTPHRVWIPSDLLVEFMPVGIHLNEMA